MTPKPAPKRPLPRNLDELREGDLVAYWRSNAGASGPEVFIMAVERIGGKKVRRVYVNGKVFNAVGQQITSDHLHPARITVLDDAAKTEVRKRRALSAAKNRLSRVEDRIGALTTAQHEALALALSPFLEEGK